MESRAILGGMLSVEGLVDDAYPILKNPNHVTLNVGGKHNRDDRFAHSAKKRLRLVFLETLFFVI